MRARFKRRIDGPFRHSFSHAALRTLGLGVVAAVLLATGAALSHNWFHHRTDRAEAILAEFRLLASLSTRTDLAAAAILLNPNNSVYASDGNQPALGSIARLSEYADDPDVRAVIESFERFRAGIEQARILVAIGQPELAQELIDEQVRPDGLAFRELTQSVLPGAVKRAAEANRIQLVFDYGSIAAGVSLVALLIVRPSIDRHRARQALREKRAIAAEQAALWRIGELSVSDTELNSLLPQIASAVLGTAGIECCSVEIWHPERDETELVAEATIEEWPGTAEVPARLPLANYPHTRWVLEHRKPLRVSLLDADLTERERQTFLDSGAGTHLIVPLLVDQRCLGAITLHSRGTDAFDERAAAVARELAALMALAIENARFREEIRRHAAEQTRLLELSRDAEERYRTLVEQLPAITYVEPLPPVSETMCYLYVSPQVEPLLGYPVEQWRTDAGLWRRILHPDDRDRMIACNARRMATGDPFREEYRVIAADGRVVWLYDQATLVTDEHGVPRYWHGIQLDTTALNEAEAKQREAEAEFRVLFSRNPHPTWVCDRETLEVLEVNDVAVSHYGFKREAFLGMRFSELWAQQPSAMLRPHGAHASPVDGPHGRGRHKTSDGTVIDVEVTSHALEFRKRPAVLVIAQDVTARLALEAQLAHQAYHDALTGLPNRARFADLLEQALTGSDPITVLFIDLDNFKVTNDTLGHSAGDTLLVAVGERLARNVRPGDTLARLGGDEFTVLLERGGERAATAIAERLRRALSESFLVHGHEIAVSASVGIALGQPGVDTPEELLRRADIAMYQAKQRGRAQHVIFDQAMDATAWRRLSLDRELRRALQQEEFRLHFQPIVDLSSGELSEVEALVRWQHPERGLLAPDEFIPLAEETGLIVQIGLWVLRHACAQGARWARERPEAPLVVCVNLSARQFLQPSLVAEIEQALADTGLPPGCLKVEITETVAMSDVDTSAATLRALKAIGVRLAMDDFGTGYSSLSYLRHCPVDTLKIDRSYISALGHEAADTALVQAVLAFARTLGLSVTAEGVEAADQVAELRELGCDRAQGFYFAPPMDADELARLLRREPVSITAAAD